MRSRDLPVCSIVPQPLRYRIPPFSEYIIHKTFICTSELKKAGCYVITSIARATRQKTEEALITRNLVFIYFIIRLIGTL
jgi:hypothetical protein